VRILVILFIAVFFITVAVETFYRPVPFVFPPKITLAPAPVPILHRAAVKPTLVAVRRGPIDISGPLKARAIIKQSLPSYPEWAEEDGIAGIVSYRIWVDPKGRLRSFIQMMRASGYPPLDETALGALKEWEFVALPNTVGNQWGIVTFRFTLDNTLPRREFTNPVASLNPHEALHPVWRIR